MTFFYSKYSNIKAKRQMYHQISLWSRHGQPCLQLRSKKKNLKVLLDRSNTLNS